MPKGYWIVRVDIADQEKYKAYIAANAEPLKKHGARFLVRAGSFENPEGTSRSRNAVIEFPSMRALVNPPFNYKLRCLLCLVSQHLLSSMYAS
jgi:uncharacterized protein (DUF1330 family)